MDGRRGALVVMDVNDGAVKVFISSPTYDPNPLTWGISSKEWSALMNDKDKPMMNRVIGGAYPPGSIFKVVTASGILMERVASTGDKVFCPGYFRIGDPPKTFRCWHRSGHGTRDIVGALRDSCDVYFYEKGTKLGIDKLITWGREYGVGERTGIDIPGEIRGNIAGRDWKRSRIGESWYHGDTVNYTIGQGYLLMTPMQLARVYAAIANGGRLVVPHFNADKKPGGPQMKVSKATLDIVRRGVEEVVRSGTGRRTREFGVDMAGKTGTAQNSQGEDHALFVGYAPVKNPKYVAAALIEGGGAGSSVAGPVVAQMLGYLLQHGI
jgi:penicillin-binding protein 2